ncbi:uncharacterized protein LOC142574238 [Dermacentor variabilis]|uniref:uncharacterized protein LOC142574238 n=1 Tax=Dermacentor variabilis TaxID=34621 RepID=UPI003F5C8B23
MLQFHGLLYFSTIALAVARPLGFQIGQMVQIERKCTPVPYSNLILCITMEMAGPPVGVVIGDDFGTGTDNEAPWLIEPDSTQGEDSELNVTSDLPETEEVPITENKSAEASPSEAVAPADGDSAEGSASTEQSASA